MTRITRIEIKDSIFGKDLFFYNDLENVLYFQALGNGRGVVLWMDTGGDSAFWIKDDRLVFGDIGNLEPDADFLYIGSFRDICTLRKLMYND